MKKILFIYPHNFLERNMGTNNRIYSIAEYLKKKGCTIDVFAMKNFVSQSFDEYGLLNKDEIVNHFYLYDFNEVKKYKRKKNILSTFRKFFGHCLSITQSAEIDNWVTPGMTEQFKSILQNNYDSIVCIYLYSGTLFKDIKTKSKKISCMEDFLSISDYYTDKTKEIGALLASEIKRYSYFDSSFFISSDEKIFFDKLFPDIRSYFVPPLIRTHDYSPGIAKDIDVLFVGHDNLHNINGIRWFLENVRQNIHSALKIHIAGKVTDYIHSEHNNVIKLGYVDNLDELYHRTKVVICPLLGGTGMKIKVVEAMSYGIPVVTTPRGIDGFPDKNKNGCLVTEDPMEFAGFINQLSRDASFHQTASQNVRSYIEHYLSYETTCHTLDKVFGLD